MFVIVEFILLQLGSRGFPKSTIWAVHFEKTREHEVQEEVLEIIIGTEDHIWTEPNHVVITDKPCIYIKRNVLGIEIALVEI